MYGFDAYKSLRVVSPQHDHTIIPDSCSQQLKICHCLESHCCMLLGHVVNWKERVFCVFFYSYYWLVEFAHKTNDKSNITAFGSLKLGPWYEMQHVSDINLKHEQYDKHLIILCVKGSSGLGNSLNHTCTTSDLSQPCMNLLISKMAVRYFFAENCLRAPLPDLCICFINWDATTSSPYDQ